MRLRDLAPGLALFVAVGCQAAPSTYEPAEYNPAKFTPTQYDALVKGSVLTCVQAGNQEFNKTRRPFSMLCQGRVAYPMRVDKSGTNLEGTPFRPEGNVLDYLKPGGRVLKFDGYGS